MTNSRWEQINTATNYSVPCWVFPTDQSPCRGNIVVLPALGIRASYYQPIAEALCAQGFNVILFEQRGYGKSTLKPSRSISWTFKELAWDDLNSVLDWCDQNFPGETALMGHSLGGHLAVIYQALNPQRQTRLILSACGSPYSKAFSGVAKYQIGLLIALVPVMNLVFGFYNGHLLGFGGREARGVMSDWRQLAKLNKYVADGEAGSISEELSKYTKEILALRYTDDTFAPEASVEAVVGNFLSADISRIIISKEQLYAQTAHASVRADHFSWVKRNQATVKAIDHWW